MSLKKNQAKNPNIGRPHNNKLLGKFFSYNKNRIEQVVEELTGGYCFVELYSKKYGTHRMSYRIVPYDDIISKKIKANVKEFMD